jgi:hypothetical protein
MTQESPRRGMLEEAAPLMVWKMGKLHWSATFNGQPRRIAVEPGTTLLEALRGGLGLTGTKKSRDRGECGACTVRDTGKAAVSDRSRRHFCAPDHGGGPRLAFFDRTSGARMTKATVLVGGNP